VRSKLWSKAPAMEDFMLQTGWTVENECIKFTDERHLRLTIDLLAHERTRVIPSDKEWVAESKVEKINLNGAFDPREERLRQEAAGRREAELAACLEDREQRRLLHETIKLNIRSDMEHRRKLREESSHPVEIVHEN